LGEIWQADAKSCRKHPIFVLAPLHLRPNGSTQMLLLLFLLPSGVKIPRVKSKVKSKRKAEVVTPRR